MKNYLKLTLTDIGQKTMLRLIQLGKKPTLSIGVSHVTNKFLGNEVDLASKFHILPEAKITFQDDKTKLHIQAFLPEIGSVYDIYQIGLFLKQIPGEEDKLILLANYCSEERLVQKMPKQDMILDIIVYVDAFEADNFTVDVKDASPLFSMLAATPERYGSVRLATAQDIEKPIQNNELVLSTALLADSTHITNKQPGFILTTNHIDSFISQQTNHLQAFKPVSIYEGTAAIQEKAETIVALATFCDDDFVYFFIPVKTSTVNTKLFISRYNFKTHTIKDSVEIKEVSALLEEGNDLQAAGIFTNYNGKNRIAYYFFTQKNNSTILRKLTVQSNGEMASKFESGQVNSVPIGRSFLYNQNLANIAVSSVKEIIINFFDGSLNRQSGTFSLPYKGSDVFAHVMQDQVVCIAMVEEETQLYPSVALYKFSGSTPSTPTFTDLPFPTANLDFKQFTLDSTILSCQLDFFVYFFSLSHKENTKLKSDYYQYDVLNNQWSKLSFQAGSQVSVSGKFQAASLAKQGKQMYLCIASLDPANLIALSMIKLNR